MKTKMLLGSAVIGCLVLSGLCPLHADDATAQKDKDAKKTAADATRKDDKTAKTDDKTAKTRTADKTTHDSKTVDKTVHTTDKTTVVKHDDQGRHDDVRHDDVRHDDHHHEYIVRNGHRGYWINIAGFQVWVDADL